MAEIPEPRLVNAAVFETERVAIGMFRCPVSYPSFRNTGPIDRCIVVFPRTSVWIQHDGSRQFLADPTIATIYNRSQQYERFAASLDGDRCEWFGVADDLAREIAAVFDEPSRDGERPFRLPWAPSNVALYLRQRALFRRACVGRLDALEAEEEVIDIVAEVLGATPARLPSSGVRRTSVARRHLDLTEAAKVELQRTLGDNRSVHQIASSLGTSPYHLCRVFRACAGRTLHEHRSDLRVRAAFEMFEGPSDRRASLSRVAHALGFSSHSHFVQAMRLRAGITPGAARALVG
jgi:AraC-like DNA-binding protein